MLETPEANVVEDHLERFTLRVAKAHAERAIDRPREAIEGPGHRVGLKLLQCSALSQALEVCAHGGSELRAVRPHKHGDEPCFNIRAARDVPLASLGGPADGPRGAVREIPATMNAQALARALFDDPSRTFAVQLWDGSVLPGPRAPPALVLKSEAVLKHLLPPLEERAIAQAFGRGDLDIDGDAVSLLEAVARWGGPSLHAKLAAHRIRTTFAKCTADLRRRFLRATGWSHAKRQDRRAVRVHYDLGDDFFRLFLDESMTYSCAYFPSGDESLAEAQRSKLDLVARKLGLRTGQKLLDIGCGWGSLVNHASQAYGVTACGITISDSQLREVQRRAMTTGVTVLRRDYRDAPRGPFDRVVSVGMMEHVGGRNLDRYFRAVYDRLRPGGLFLNHAIADISGKHRMMRWLDCPVGGFVLDEIFPGSELLPLAAVVRAAEANGFEVRDVEPLREHYAQTLACWIANLDARFADAVFLVGLEMARKWRLYLAASAAAFRVGAIGVYQVLLAKRDEGGRAVGLPRSRAKWYDPAPHN